MTVHTTSITKFAAFYKNKEIKVAAEFPVQSDRKAEQEFIDRLKEIYLGKIDLESLQSEKETLPYHPARDKEEKCHE